MVLINNLTVDEINAALLHLQRSQSEVVGGEKGTTIQNITITNTGGGSGNSGGTVSQDWSPIIDALESRINAAEKATLELDKKAAENEQIDSAQTEQISSILEQLMSLSSNGITSLQFDATNRYLIIYTEDGNTYDVQITSEPITMTFDSTTNKLTLVMGSQTQEVTLPYINANQKGVAGGVATLDESGRVPYSQLPESAMEFKGEWNASTNTPTLADGTGTNGDFYICNVGGTVNFGTQAEPREVTFVPNDRVIYNGDSDLWVKLPAGQVASVNGQSGVVELTSADIPYDSNAQSPSVKDMLDDLEPVDEVTVNNMQSVTSNAVAQAIASASNPEIIDDSTITNCNNAYILGKSVVYKISRTASNAPSTSGQLGNEITLVSYTYYDSNLGPICYQIAYLPLSRSNNNMLTYCRVGRPNISWGNWEFLNNGEINQKRDANEAYELGKSRVYTIYTSTGTNLPPTTQGVARWLITSNANSDINVTQIAVGSGSLISSSNITFYKAIYYRVGIYYNGMQWSDWSALATKDDLTSKSSDKQGSWGILGGAAGSDKTNFVDLIRTLTGQNYGGGICGGSINTTTTSCGIPAGWYNFLYIPHRTGIGSDNYNYGNLLVFPMTQTNTYFYKIQMSGATILNAVRYGGTQL